MLLRLMDERVQEQELDALEIVSRCSLCRRDVLTLHKPGPAK